MSEKPLAGGYEIGYSNDIQQGMSGGPILDGQGKVIGINGLGSFAILDDAYQFQDGTKASDKQLQVMRQLNWGIPIETFVALNQIAPPLTGVAAQVDSIAAKITVRINLVEEGNGSGVIIAQQGNTYYVLTAAHVLKNQFKYKVVTHDGRSYTPNYAKATILSGVDLAVLQFSSEETYPVATLGDRDLGLDEIEWVFVSGFPGSRSGFLHHTRKFTAGVVRSKDRGSLELKDSYSLIDAQYGGYELVYTNISQRGMSGGPVLDSRGYLIWH